MPTRTTFYAEQLATASVSSNAAYVQVTAFSFVNAASAAYYVGASWSMSNTSDVRQNSMMLYMETGATATVGNYNNTIGGVVGDWISSMVIKRVVTPTSAGTQVFSVRMVPGTDSTDQRMRDLRMFAIKATAADGYAEHDIEVWATTAAVTAASAALTVSSAGVYWMFGIGAVGTDGGITNHKSRFTHQSSGIAMNDLNRRGAINARDLHIYSRVASLAAGTHSLQFQIETGSTTVKSDWSRAIALRLDQFNSHSVAETDVTAALSSTTYVTALGHTTAMSANLRYAMFFTNKVYNQGSTTSFYTRSLLDAGQLSEHNIAGETGAPGGGSGGWRDRAIIALVSGSSGSHELRTEARVGVADAGALTSHMAILLLGIDATAATSYVGLPYQRFYGGVPFGFGGGRGVI